LTTAVDTNIFLDILLADRRFVDRSRENLIRAGEEGRLIICEVVMAELSSVFFRRGRGESDILSFLSDIGVELVPSSVESLFRAAEAWNLYISRRGRNIICPECGRSFDVRCPDCGRIVVWRQHIVTDFLIGAHALLHADRLLTRDRGYYGSYFPELQVMY